MMFMFKACIYYETSYTVLRIFYLLHTTRIEKDLLCRVLFRHYNSTMLPQSRVILSHINAPRRQTVWEA
jgi:hypothetical protein